MAAEEPVNPIAALQVLRSEVASINRHYDQRFTDLNRILDEMASTFSRSSNERERYVEQRFTDQDKAVQAALQAADKAVQAALLAAKEAVIKAELASEKRFDAGREFRGQLSDQASTFMPRAEAEIRLTNLSDRIGDNTTALDRDGGGSMASSRIVGVILSLGALLLSLGAIIAIIVFH